MATFATGILPALDAIRAIGGKLGLRPYSVKIRVRAWGGARVGMGIKTDTDTLITNQAADGTVQPVMMRQLSRREVIASGGLYADRDLRVGPITPPFSAAFLLAAAGFDDTKLDPAATVTPTEIFWILASSGGTFGLPASGVLAAKMGEEATALTYYIILRSTGRVP